MTNTSRLNPPPSRENALNNTTTSNPRDLERERAARAWDSIKSAKGQSYEKKYGSLARKLSTMIQVNGLAQTLAFLKAKGESHHNQAYDHISVWVCDRFNWQDTDLLTRTLSNSMDSQQYRLATAESLAFLQWLKRFAEAELDTEEN